MPIYEVTWTKEVDALIEADDEEELREAVAELAKNGDLDRDWYIPRAWDFSVERLHVPWQSPSPLRPHRPHCGLWNGEIYDYNDYLKLRAEEETG